ncbi:hypothetical protein ACFO3D_01390 [Virgibacillus kekensis]|uniref:Spore germination protein n=1 Tax=Virgibacillus kekensis TaxID=202261 RepID=A0ABV9DG80_9BACI
MIADMQITIVNIKVFNISGTSSFIIGKGEQSDFSSQSKSNNGIGTVYGDGSDINMSPDHLTLNDPDLLDSISKQQYFYQPEPTPFEEFPAPPLWGWVPPDER